MGTMPRLPLLILVLCFFLLPAAALAQLPVRVLLDATASVNINLREAHRGYADGRLLFETQLPLDWPLSASGGRVLADDIPIGRILTLEPASGTLTWQGREYRGAISVIAAGAELLIVNSLDLEDYLRGVVPSEMQASWPAEALKAQAVAARSYVVASLQPEADYDICATVDCQMYRGLEREHAHSDTAVRQTAGLVLTYGGQFARTYYHSDSGGVIASSAEVWGGDLPYLTVFRDVEHSTPHRQWQQTLDPAAVSAALRSTGFDVGTASAMTITSLSESGRVAGLQVSGTAGSATLNGSQATALLRAIGLKSTRLQMIGALTVRGDGYGHGVGMSQHGAHRLAQGGHSFDQILAFYYPGTELRRLSFTAETQQP